MAKKSEYMQALTKDDIKGRTWVECDITPKTPKDRLAESQLVQSLRAPGAGGKPFVSDLDIAKMLDFPHPEELSRNVDMQLFAMQDPDVQTYQKAALLAQWKDANPEAVKVAEKALDPEPDKEFEMLKKSLTPEQFQSILQIIKAQAMAEAQGVTPEQFLAGHQQGAAMQQAAQAQLQQVPATVMPPGQPDPRTMPTAMGMPGSAAQTSVSQPIQQANAIRRGKPANKP